MQYLNTRSHKPVFKISCLPNMTLVHPKGIIRNGISSLFMYRTSSSEEKFSFPHPYSCPLISAIKFKICSPVSPLIHAFIRFPLWITYLIMHVFVIRLFHRSGFRFAVYTVIPGLIHCHPAGIPEYRRADSSGCRRLIPVWKSGSR